MRSDIFANNLKIVSKRSDGKAVAAFPDVCLTPLSPDAEAVPLPYPNTGEARDLGRGSSQVLIEDHMIGLENTSHLNKSQGSESAGRGVITGASRGRVYFQAWSMNVKIEGRGTPRSLDVTTHNHASVPGQVPGIYIAKSAYYQTNYKMEMKVLEEGKSLVFAVHHIVEKNEKGAGPARQVLWGGAVDNNGVDENSLDDNGLAKKGVAYDNREDRKFQPEEGHATGGVGIHINAPVNLVGLPSCIRQNEKNRKVDEKKPYTASSGKNEKEYAEQYGIIHYGRHSKSYYGPVNRIVVKAQKLSSKDRLDGYQKYQAALLNDSRSVHEGHAAYDHEEVISKDINASEHLAVGVALRRIAMRLLNHEGETWADVLKKFKP